MSPFFKVESLTHTMHEFKEFVDDRFEEFPVSSQEPGVLPYHVHDVRGYDRFVIFTSLLFTQAQQILQPSHYFL